MSYFRTLSSAFIFFLPLPLISTLVTTRDLHQGVLARLMRWIMGFDSAQTEDGNRRKHGILG